MPHNKSMIDLFRGRFFAILYQTPEIASSITIKQGLDLAQRLAENVDNADLFIHDDESVRDYISRRYNIDVREPSNGNHAVAVSYGEGQDWHPWPITDASLMRNIFAVKFADGWIWDWDTGWRKDREASK